MDREKYLIDDRIIIPDKIKNMSPKELDAEIERLEKKAKDKKMENVSLDKAV